MSDLLARNTESLSYARSRYNQSLIVPVKPLSSGVYQGFDSSSGTHTVQLADGSIVSGQFISNGAAGVGDVISVTRTRGSLIASFDVMPR